MHLPISSIRYISQSSHVQNPVPNSRNKIFDFVHLAIVGNLQNSIFIQSSFVLHLQPVGMKNENKTKLLKWNKVSCMKYLRKLKKV